MTSLAGVISLVLAVTLPLASPGRSRSGGWQSTDQQASTAASEDERIVEGIEGTKTVHGVLEQVRAALGGQKALLAVTSLMIEGDRDGARFTYRILLPDRFQSRTSERTFTIDGPTRYVQTPDVSDETKAIARKNTTQAFVTQCLTTLIRAPSALRVRATLPKLDKPGTVLVMFTTAGGFAILLEIDSSTFLPKAYSYIGNLEEGTCGEPPTVSSATRRVAFDEYHQVAGIHFPARMTDTITTADGRAFVSAMQFTSIRVNEGISQADFAK
jgi:hypothetical protein